MTHRYRTISLALSYSFKATLFLLIVLPPTPALAEGIPGQQDAGHFPMEDFSTPLPTDGKKEAEEIAFGSDAALTQSDPSPGESPFMNSDTFSIEPHHVVSPVDLSGQGISIQSAAAMPDGWTTIMSEDFEGAFPSPGWTVFDGDGATNGEYFWDDDDYKPYSGGWSAWPANGGADGVDPQTFYYPNNMDSWMVYGPFDLSDALDAELHFYYWLQSEQNYDYFGWYASTDGSNFIGFATSGDSGGWLSVNFDLTSVPTLGDVTGVSSVWIAFIFTSDGTNVDDGAFVDNVFLQKNLGPNLIPYVPAGWEHPIVPSTVTGTNTVGTLYTYQNTYIDFAVINSGTAIASGRFYTCLYFDGIERNCWFTDDLGVGWYAWVEDWLLNLSPTPGWHNLEIVADVYNDIVEVNETDNAWSMDFYWHPNANLAPYKQGSWDYPLVPSSLTGTNSVNDLYTFQNTYIDWTVKNLGPDDILAQFDTCIYVDNVEIYCWYTNGKIAGNIAFVEDWILNITPTPGWHNLKIVTDVNDDVAESDESDNAWSADFYWYSSPIPDIYISPASLISQQTQDQVQTLKLEVRNYGNANLNWTLNEAPTASCSATDIPWVYVSPFTGTTASSSTTIVDVVFNSAGLTTGTYQGVLCASSDDPDQPLITVPITLEIIEELTIFLPMLLRP